MNATIKHFDTLDFVNEARKSDIRESKLSLQQEIKSLELKILYLYGGGFMTLLAVLAKGFHWF